MPRSKKFPSFCAALVAVSPLCAQGPIPTALVRPAPVAKPAAGPSRAIDLVICLDVSGSMEGLIHAARQNLWAVVNDLATLQPTPDLRVALLTFGCPAYGQESGFVAVQTGLTSDLDLVSQKLFALTTNGGDEYVARVVHRALSDLEWSTDQQALKLLFVAGNEAATQDPMFDALAQSQAAIERGILVNTIFCGDPNVDDAQGWKQVALRADGKFAAIQKDEEVVIESPFDKQLAELSGGLNATYVPYGQNAVQWVVNQGAQDNNAAGLNTVAAAQRCQTKASGLYFNGQWDLVDATKDPTFDLATVKKEDLPDPLRAMSLEQLKAHVEQKRSQREALQKQVAELGQKRDAFVAEVRKKRSAAGEKLFEDAVLESVRAQAASRGFQKKPQAVPVPEKPEETVDPRFAPVLEQAVEGYQQFVRVTGQPHMAPTDCRIPGPFARTSAATKQHGGKLYLLYARFADDLVYVKPGEPAKVGQTLVKEAWERVDGPQQGATEANERYPFGLTYEAGAQRFHAGDSYGLFVMHKLAPETEGTDQGWVYGTFDRAGKLTAAGRVASCMRCHETADNDRRFGLD